MSRGIDCGGGVVGWDDQAQLGLVLCTTIERDVHWDLLLADSSDLDLGCALLTRGVRAGTEDGRLAQRELKPAQDDSVEVVRLDRRRERDPVARAVACA